MDDCWLDVNDGCIKFPVHTRTDMHVHTQMGTHACLQVSCCLQRMETSFPEIGAFFKPRNGHLPLRGLEGRCSLAHNRT